MADAFRCDGCEQFFDLTLGSPSISVVFGGPFAFGDRESSEFCSEACAIKALQERSQEAEKRRTPE